MILCFALIACSISGERVIEQINDHTTTENTTTELTTESKTDLITELSSEHTTETKTEITTETTTEGVSVSPDFDLSDIPPYSGKAYITINDNVPFFSDAEKQTDDIFEMYSDLDDFGRCGVAYANLCKELMPTEERGEIGDIRPSGWHTVKYNELIDGNYLYNRCHLIAYSLAGENDNVKNLITGTRSLNQETMQIFELRVLEYLRSHDNHVLYRVTPNFKGDDLVASGVQMEAYSIEDQGQGICFNVYCYNIQPGISIDYANGDSCVDSDLAESEATESVATETVISRSVNEDEANVCDYIVNTKSGKIHLPSCSGVQKMAEHNKMYYSGTIDELKQMGYVPCKLCNP
ncbi:MAG: DNA/RNA non-specific endonuclease [Eubacterium sp.]|nr:DNA/RNA non-specific endonuclease [Eubacterium sp.]